MSAGDPYCSIHGQGPCSCMQFGKPMLGNIRSGPPIDDKPVMFSSGIVYDQPTRDPALRKAALDALLAYRSWIASLIAAMEKASLGDVEPLRKMVVEQQEVAKAMAALREELAK